MSWLNFCVHFFGLVALNHSTCPSAYASLLDSLDACYYDMNGDAQSSNEFWNKCVEALAVGLHVPQMSGIELETEHPCVFCIEKTVKLLWEMEYNPRHECFIVNNVSPCGELYRQTKEQMLECLRLGGSKSHGSESTNDDKSVLSFMAII
jgi:hypothetical protein